jgi:hypothetical protein
MNLYPFKIFQIGIHERKAFQGIVVSVKEDPGVRRVVKGSVKGLEVFKGESGDPGRIASGVEPVGVAGKKGLL